MTAKRTIVVTTTPDWAVDDNVNRTTYEQVRRMSHTRLADEMDKGRFSRSVYFTDILRFEATRRLRLLDAMVGTP